MKKNIILLTTGLASLTLMAFIFTDHEPSAKGGVEWREVFLPTCNSANMVIADFHYEVGTRFRANITKSDLDKATLISDLVPEEAGWDTHLIKDTEVALMVEQGETMHVGTGSQLNEDQLGLLKKADYSDDLRLLANCEKKNWRAGEMEPYHLIYYVTVEPETAAEYSEGHEAFVAYLKDNSREVITGLRDDLLRPGKVRFTIDRSGKLSGAQLLNTCGYQTVDEKMVELIMGAPGDWEPARDAKGNRIAQDLVFSFGKVGC